MKTQLCEFLGNHGDQTRRSVAADGWESMYTGKCAGTVYSIDAREREEQEEVQHA